MNTFSTADAVRFGWKTFKERAWFLIGTTLVFLGIVIACAALVAGLIAAVIVAHLSTPLTAIMVIALVVAALAVVMLLGMGYTALSLKCHDDLAAASYNDLWHPHPFWKFVGVRFLTSIIVLVGFILLVVPGVYWMLTYLFAPFIVIDKGLGPVEALKESRRITTGNRWELALVIVAMCIINMIGYQALFIGLFVTTPISMLVLVHTYRALSKHHHTA